MNSKVQQCRRCGKLFQSYGKAICSDCAEEMDQYYIMIKDYIYDHPDANVIEISKETKIAEITILYFLKEGRLSICNNSGVLVCEKCGKSISSGKYCASCLDKLGNALSSVCRTAQQRTKERASTNGLGKMHFDLQKK